MATQTQTTTPPQWTRTPISTALGLEYPIIGAPMANVSGPELTVAVSEAGGLGSLGGAMMPPNELRAAIRAIKQATKKPFAVNLFAWNPNTLPENRVKNATKILTSYLEKYNLSSSISMGKLTSLSPETFGSPNFLDRQMAVVLEESVPVFSCTFGLVDQKYLDELRKQKTYVIGSATNTDEAIYLAKKGVDAICAQGTEAGGHRGTFIGEAEDSVMGMVSLVQAIQTEVKIPIIAAGGIGTSGGVVASLALGAAAAQVGTLFLICPESTASAPYKAHLTSMCETSSAGESTIVSRAYSGRAARVLRNKYTDHVSQFPRDELLPYFYQGLLSSEMRKWSVKNKDSMFLANFAGQSLATMRRVKGWSAKAIVADLVKNIPQVLRRLI